MRAMNLADALIERGHEVTIWTSDFYHQTKSHRYGTFAKLVYSARLTINLVPSPGYVRNIGLGRLLDHAVLAYRFRSQLRRESGPLPDVAFVGYPPIELASTVLKWLKSKSIPSILDVKDQWPSLFLDATPRVLRPLIRLLLSPYFFLGKLAMNTADVRCSMSSGYLKWIADFSGRRYSSNDILAPLTFREPEVSDQEMLVAREWWFQRGVDLSKKNKFIFVGSFMSVFDFTAIKDAAERLAHLDVSCQLVICGNGGSERELKQMMAGLPNVVFPGWVDLPKIVSLAESAVASLIPYKNIDNFTLNVPNKIIDSLALGLPIISTLDGEVGCLVRENRLGFCSASADGETLANEMVRLLHSPQLVRSIRVRAKNLYRERFGFYVVYGALVERIEKLGSRL
jgi:glycosyltransferase involved in cell wall biosynthesis